MVRINSNFSKSLMQRKKEVGGEKPPKREVPK